MRFAWVPLLLVACSLESAAGPRAAIDDPGTWSEIGPPFRAGATAGWDSAGGRMLLIGGYDVSFSSRFSSTLWSSVPGGAWSQVPIQGTGPRLGRWIVYDSRRQRFLLAEPWRTRSTALTIWALETRPDARWVELWSGDTLMQTPIELLIDPLRDRLLVLSGSIGSYDSVQVHARSLETGGSWTRFGALGRYFSGVGFMCVYDATNDRLLGTPQNTGITSSPQVVWELPLSAPLRVDTLTTLGATPPGRLSGTMVWDGMRERMLLVGGTGADGALADVWALSVAGTAQWTRLEDMPAALNNVALVVDPVNGDLWTYGGLANGGATNRTQRLDAGSGQWSSFPPDDWPPRRFGGSMVVDPSGDRALLFGGSVRGDSASTSAFTNDLWQLDIGATPTWRRLSPKGEVPDARYEATLVVDPERNRAILFGGLAKVNGLWVEYSDLWSLDLGPSPQWSRLEPEGAVPSGRYGHAAIYDPVRGRMVVVGGAPSLTGLLEVWSLSLGETSRWQREFPIGVSPVPTSEHAITYDPEGDRIVLVGETPRSSRNDIWTLSLADPMRWEKALDVPPNDYSSPLPMRSHTAVFDPIGRRIVKFAGLEQAFEEYPGNSLWSITLGDSLEWVPMHAGGDPPPPMFDHVAVYDPRNDRMLVCGYWYTASLWQLRWSRPEASRALQAKAAVVDDAIALAWQLTNGGRVVVERRVTSGPWTRIAEVSVGTDRWVRHRDVTAAGGGRVAYRLTASDGTPLSASEVWVDAPTGASFALFAPWPNPSTGRLTVSFVLVGASDAKLEWFDVSGRRVQGQELRGLAPGLHAMTIEPREHLPAGVYLLRLSEGPRSEVRRIAFVR